MQALRILLDDKGALQIEPLALPVIHREGSIDAEPYRLQASGALPMPDQKLAPSSGLRTIRIANSNAIEFFGMSGPLLTFITSGQLTLTDGRGRSHHLEPGDLFLVEEPAKAHARVSVSGVCHLVQAGVDEQWPGTSARVQECGTINPRTGTDTTPLRIFEGDDRKSYFEPFPELFAADDNVWSEVRPTKGSRFLCFADGGFIDWHPEVVNNLAIFLSGEIELEAGGGEQRIRVLHAGDVLLAQDRTGDGHIDRFRGTCFLALFVIDDEHLWAGRALQ